MTTTEPPVPARQRTRRAAPPGGPGRRAGARDAGRSWRWPGSSPACGCELSRLVGPSGSVVGIDQSSKALRWAASRCEAQGLRNVSFVHDDLHEMRLTGQVDAVVGRLVLLYTPDPAAVLRKFAGYARPGGVVVSMEYEMSVAGLLPATPLSERLTH